MNRIYLDYAATTPVDPAVLEAMLPYFSEIFGNPSSLHSSGQTARKAIFEARKEIATTLNCTPSEVVFTAGGTESNNLAIFGVVENHQRGHIITTAIEHESVLEPFKELKKRGFKVTYLPVNEQGIVTLKSLKDALTDDTIFISVMYANNEIGTIQPVLEIGEFLQTLPSPPVFHTDACQAVGSLPIDVKQLKVDLLTLNGGKIYGPKGVGALFVKNGINLKSQILGGGQERRLRSGTENVPGIIGLAKALSLSESKREPESARLTELRDLLLKGITQKHDKIMVNGDSQNRLPNNLNLTIKGAEGAILLIKMDSAGVDASAGSACTAGSAEPSHVLKALGRSAQEAHQAVRFSLGRYVTRADIEKTIDILDQIIGEIRAESASY